MDLIAELKREWGSHLYADLSGWSFAATYGEAVSAVHTSAFLNSNRDVKKHPKPFEFVMPWTASQLKDDVTPEEREALKAQLLKRSAFRT